MTSAVPIGVAARETGIKVPTIRYYEKIGLLPPPPRTPRNRRSFDDCDLRRLKFIRHARGLGFEIDSIRALLLLQDNPDQSCIAADQIACARLTEVEQRISSLAALKIELERMIAGCKRGHVRQCRVIQVLADHSQCQNLRH